MKTFLYISDHTSTESLFIQLKKLTVMTGFVVQAVNTSF